MKMFKFFGKHGLAVLTSLALCASLAAPAFAQDAYFYGDLSTDEIDQIKGTDPNFNEYRPKNNPNNGGWVFLGKGEAPNGDTTEFTDGKLSEGYTAPAAKNDDGTQTVYTTDAGNVTVVPFHDLGAYKYDDGAEGTEVGQYSYTVVWTEAKTESGGATLQGSETTGNTSEGKIVISRSNTINVDGDIQLHENAEVKVVVKDFKDGQLSEEGTDVEGTKYVRDTEKDNADVVKTAANQLVESFINANSSYSTPRNADSFVDAYYDYSTSQNEDGSITATYSEKTYQVTYQVTGANSGVDVSSLGGKKGVVSEGWADKLMAAALSAMDVGYGVYRFTGWNAVVDPETGDVTVTAACTFEPYEFNPPTTTIIDEPAVPLAAGPVTRAEFLDYLWRHEDAPESAGVCTFTDVEDTHEYFDALCWAEENGIAEAYFDAEGHEDGTFEPDELVTVGAVREFLDNFARVFGTNAVAAADLTTLAGDDDEAVLNCDEVLAEFFGEEYVSAEEDEAA